MLSMRIISSAIFFVLFFVALFVPQMELLMLLLLALGAVAGIHEFMGFGRQRPERPLLALAMASGLALLVNAYWFHYQYAFLIIGVMSVLALAWATLPDRPLAAERVGLAVTSVIYVALPLSLIMAIWRRGVIGEVDSPQHYIIFLVLVTWASDIGAFFVGRAFGRHKLAPTISPGKTVEGLLGGVASTLLVAIAMKLLWDNIDRIFSWGEVLGLALVFSLAGPWGDLAESRLKRSAGIKDSGQTFTGHGGMLDIIDSLLFTTIIYYAYLRFFHGVNVL